MQTYQSSKMLRVYLNEKDRFDGKPLYEAIVAKCRQLSIAGATVFRGVQGFGRGPESDAHLAHDLPVMVTIVDTNENVSRLLPEIRDMIGGGLIVASDVTMRRVQARSRAAE